MRKKTEAEIHIYIDRERTSRSRQRELFEEFDRGDERAEQGIKDMLTALFLIYLFIIYIFIPWSGGILNSDWLQGAH